LHTGRLQSSRRGGGGNVLISEVSSVNGDLTENVLLNLISRFAIVEEGAGS
jgi:D-lyxose ketol-isomerase